MSGELLVQHDSYKNVTIVSSRNHWSCYAEPLCPEWVKIYVIESIMNSHVQSESSKMVRSENILLVFFQNVCYIQDSEPSLDGSQSQRICARAIHTHETAANRWRFNNGMDTNVQTAMAAN